MFDKQNSTTLRAILVLMVLLQHSVFSIASNWYSSSINSILLIFRGDIAVALLMMLSGIVLTKIFNESICSVSYVKALFKRLFRLVAPMIAAYLLLYIFFKLGFGRWGAEIASMGYEWGFVSPIGMLNELSVTDMAYSFVGQLLGYNDQLLLVAWLLKYELLGSLVLLSLLKLSKTLNWKKWVLNVVVATLAVVIQFSTKNGGILTCFLLGALGYMLKDAPVIGATMRNKKVLILVVITSYVLTVMSFVNGYEWKVEQYQNGNEWLVYLMTDGRYVLYSLLLPLFLIMTKQLARFSYISHQLCWLGERAYSVYLVHQLVIMAVAMAIGWADFYLPPLFFLLAVIFFTVLCSDIFYRFIELPSKDVFSKTCNPFVKSKELGCA